MHPRGPRAQAGNDAGTPRRVANVAIYFTAKRVGVSMIAEFQKGALSELPFFQPAVSTMISAIPAALVAMLMNRLSSGPSKAYVSVAAVFTLLSMWGPLMLPGASMGLRVVLSLMHVAAAIPITLGILRDAVPDRDGVQQ